MNIGNPLREINWVEKSNTLEVLLEHEGSFHAVSLDSGLEAEVMKIAAPTADYVLKVWNKASKPNVHAQYQILSALFTHGSSVSEPVGWGTNRNGDSTLLTSYDGMPVQTVDPGKLAKLVQILADIHKLPLEDFIGDRLPRYEFIDYFFPRIEEHPDIRILLEELLQRADMKPSCLIHGDYHLGNILETKDKLTVIDWTNAQWGDPRYDVAWSIIIMWIFASEEQADMYRAACCAEYRYEEHDLELFEAIACLRGIMLFKANDEPIGHHIIARFRSILSKNEYLNDQLL